MSRWELVERRIDDLVPYDRNSRTHSAEQVAQIANSIREFGFTNPLLIDEAGGIIAGHGRLLAARRLGMESVPCIVLAGLTEVQKRALVIADNQLALNAGWDEELLASEIAQLSELSFDVSLLGFSDEELDRMIAEATGGEQQGDGGGDGDPPPVADDPVSRRGDLWVLGRHRVLCGDSTIADEVAMIAPASSVDCLVTDPPYNVAYEGKTKDALTIQNDAMADAEFRQFLARAFAAADTAMKPGAAFYIWHADSEGFNFRGACRDVGWTVRQCLVWVKNVMVLGRQDYQWRHEPCLYGWKGGGFAQVVQRSPADHGPGVLEAGAQHGSSDDEAGRSHRVPDSQQHVQRRRRPRPVRRLRKHPDRLRTLRAVRASDRTGPEIRRCDRSSLAGVHRRPGDS